MNNWFKDHVDWLTIIAVSLLLLISIASVYSATYDAGASLYFRRQAIWALMGFLIMFAIMLVPFRVVQFLSFPLYGASVAVLMVVLVMGKVVAGSKSWFGGGGLGLRPVEIGKVTTGPALASFLSQRPVSLPPFWGIIVAFWSAPLSPA